MSEQPAKQSIDVTIDPEMMGGVWSNFASVSHSRFEFTIDFARLDFAHAKEGKTPGVVVSRVNLSPLMVTQLLTALQSNWEIYANKAMPPEFRDGE